MIELVERQFLAISRKLVKSRGGFSLFFRPLSCGRTSAGDGVRPTIFHLLSRQTSSQGSGLNGHFHFAVSRFFFFILFLRSSNSSGQLAAIGERHFLFFWTNYHLHRVTGKMAALGGQLNPADRFLTDKSLDFFLKKNNPPSRNGFLPLISRSFNLKRLSRRIKRRK